MGTAQLGEFPIAAMIASAIKNVPGVTTDLSLNLVSGPQVIGMGVTGSRHRCD
jgi:hypothetical protein